VAARIFNEGNATLSLTNCTVTGNRTGGNQIPNSGPLGGGAIRSANGTTLTVTNTTISSNIAHVGGGIWSNGTLTISGSTFASNSAGVGVSTQDDLDGGAIYVVGSGAANIVNSTFSGNAAKSRGGAVAGVGNVDISNSTLSSNTTDLGGGAVSALGPGRTVRLKGNILSNPLNCSTGGGSISSSGYNVATDAGCSLNGQGDVTNTPAGLDPAGLQNNGGPTQTIMLLASSTAKDRIPQAFCTALDNTTVSTDHAEPPAARQQLRQRLVRTESGVVFIYSDNHHRQR
jgi:predicted outer membrane repeat protein